MIPRHAGPSNQGRVGQLRLDQIDSLQHFCAIIEIGQIIMSNTLIMTVLPLQQKLRMRVGGTRGSQLHTTEST